VPAIRSDVSVETFDSDVSVETFVSDVITTKDPRTAWPVYLGVDPEGSD
jgi:hypothetical protein